MWWCCGIAFGWTLIVSILLLMTASSFLLPAFSDDGQVIDLASRYLLLVCWTFAGYGITVALSAAMNGLGRPFNALTIAGGRAMALVAPAAWLGAELAGFTGVAVGIATANALAGVVGVIIIWRHSLNVRDEKHAQRHGKEADEVSARGDKLSEAAG